MPWLKKLLKHIPLLLWRSQLNFLLNYIGFPISLWIHIVITSGYAVCEVHYLLFTLDILHLWIYNVDLKVNVFAKA
jgi:hypothetical protein